MGMIGGSLAYVDFVVDWLGVMIVVGVFVYFKGLDGECSVFVEDFFIGFYMIDLQENELLMVISIFLLLEGI